jgi:hypothetical protein
MKSKTIYIRISEDEYNRLSYVVRRSRQTVTNKVYQLIRDYVDGKKIEERIDESKYSEWLRDRLRAQGLLPSKDMSDELF